MTGLSTCITLISAKISAAGVLFFSTLIKMAAAEKDLMRPLQRLLWRDDFAAVFMITRSCSKSAVYFSPWILYYVNWISFAFPLAFNFHHSLPFTLYWNRYVNERLATKQVGKYDCHLQWSFELWTTNINSSLKYYVCKHVSLSLLPSSGRCTPN